MRGLDPFWVVIAVVGGLLAGMLMPVGIAHVVYGQEQRIGMEVEMKQVILDEDTPQQRCYDVFTRGMSGLEVRAFPCPER